MFTSLRAQAQRVTVRSISLDSITSQQFSHLPRRISRRIDRFRMPPARPRPLDVRRAVIEEDDLVWFETRRALDVTIDFWCRLHVPDVVADKMVLQAIEPRVNRP